ncbi:MAG: hypothetical protein HZB16_06650 [Armatimonadetes bacterium]|nr:hypothetical protein [Armatimonadota bacterium]
MKTLGYYVAIGLLLVLLIVLAIALAHLPWWGALLLLAFAAYMVAQTRMIWLGATGARIVAARLGGAKDCGMLVHDVKRCGDQPSLDEGEVAYSVEVTVTPRRQSDVPVEWEPAELAIWREIDDPDAEWAALRSWRRGSGASVVAEIQLAVRQVEVWDGARYVPLAHGLLTGEQRLRVRFLAAKDARRVQVYACGGLSAAVDLPAPDPAG